MVVVVDGGGWWCAQVDGQRNRTGSSGGALAALNLPPQLYVGGYSEYTPERLPLGARFRLGFQGKTAPAAAAAAGPYTTLSRQQVAS